MKHSDSKETFATGAQRDAQTDKPLPGLLSPYAAQRKAVIMQKGAVHYGARNWEKGMNFSRVVESLERHLIAFKMGLTDEDHLGQLAWNADALLHFDEGVKRGFLPTSLDDMPKYEQKVMTKTLTPERDRGSYDVEEETGKFSGGNIEAHDYAGNEKSLKEATKPASTTFPDTFIELLQSVYDDLYGRGVYLIGRRGIQPTTIAKPTVYISGPMRGKPQFNFPAFDAARDMFKAAGYNVISPADIDRQDKTKKTTKDYVKRDVDALLRSTHIAMLPGWELSKGACAEFFVAGWLGLKVLDTRTMAPFRPSDTRYEYVWNTIDRHLEGK